MNAILRALRRRFNARPVQVPPYTDEALADALRLTRVVMVPEKPS